MKAQEVKDVIRQEKLVPILRTRSSDSIYNIAKAVQDGGGRILEYTMTIDGIIREVGKVKEKFPDLVIGMGTVLDKKDAKLAIENGVDFIVSPILNYEIIDTVKAADKMIMLSGFTPTELYNAYKAGCDIVKLFPASEMHPNFIREIKGPLPFLEIFPTGGLDLITAIQYMVNGAFAVGMGSTVFNKELIDSKNFEEISVRLKNARHRIQNMEI
jgi:2-dehydro-3-deoxyphosphogluconate aldolase / (4S)-4-hydroxy-2-oxoglutarate aldolase